MPLAYEHGLQVLVLNRRTRPPAARAFPRGRVDEIRPRVLVGGGGTDLLSRRVTATPIAFTPLEVPEFETTDWKVLPKEVRTKDLGYSIYQLNLGGSTNAGFSLDVATSTT
jgi:hypothetical protein